MILFCDEITHQTRLLCAQYSGASNAGDIDYAKNSIEAPYFIDSVERIREIIEESIQFHIIYRYTPHNTHILPLSLSTH